MAEPKQAIHFATSFDGTRIAYATCGKGPPLVKAPNWLTHMEFDWTSPVAHHWLTELSKHHTLIRLDQRGCGLSDWDVADISFEAWVRDLETVVDTLGLKHFPIIGLSQGAAAAIAYTVHHPEKVSHLILYGSFCRGMLKRNPSPQQIEEAQTLVKLVEVGWGKENAAFRQVLSWLFIPGGTLEQLRWFGDKARISMSPPNAVRTLEQINLIDVCDLARQVRCPTLVLNCRHDAKAPFDEGRLTAALIPGAEFVTLDSINHVLLEHEPAWQQFITAVRCFLPPPAAVESATEDRAFDQLTGRERNVVELIALGLANDEIAERLFMSPKTVRNHITSVFSKLNVTSRAQAIVRARDAGFGQQPLKRPAS